MYVHKTVYIATELYTVADPGGDPRVTDPPFQSIATS